MAGNIAIHLGRWANPPHSRRFYDYRNQSEAKPNGSINNHICTKKEYDYWYVECENII
jgi:hypothetical protein